MTDNSLFERSVSDQDCAQQWAAGDRRAYEVLVERHAAMIFARCARQLGDSDADDACQAVFLVLLRRAAVAGKHPVFVAWLLRVCDNVIRNAKRDRSRRHRREHPQQVLPTLSDDHISGETDVMPPELLDSIDEYVSALPTREREVIELHFFAGHSLAEIARQTDTAKTTITSRMQRGLERMRSAYKKRGIQITSTLLLSCLSQVASASVPASLSASLSDRLKDMAPTVGAGSTTAIPASAQAMRWSQGNIIMSHPYISAAVGIVGAAGLSCVIGLSSMLWSADAEEKVDDGVGKASEIEIDRMLASVQFHDVARSWQRFQLTPEGKVFAALLPKKSRPAFEKIDTMSYVVELFAIADDAQRRALMKQFFVSQVSATLLDSESPQISAHDLSQTASRFIVNYKKGQEHVLDAWIDEVFLLLLGANPDEGLAQSIDKQKNRLFAQGALRSSIDATAWLQDADVQTYLDADMEYKMLIKTVAGNIIDTGSTRITFEEKGMLINSEAQSGQLFKNMESTAPALPEDVWDAVPQDAYVAGFLSLAVGDFSKKVGMKQWATIGNTRNDRAEHSDEVELRPGVANVVDILKIVSVAADNIDGQISIWLQSQALIPALTLCADLNEEASQKLLLELAQNLEMTLDNGHLQIPLFGGFAVLDIAYHQGALWASSKAGGVAAAAEFKTGFAQHTDVQTALSDMPAGEKQAALIMRTESIIALAQGMAAMVLDPEKLQVLENYRKAYATKGVSSWMATGQSNNKSWMKARGPIPALMVLPAMSGELGKILGAAN